MKHIYFGTRDRMIWAKPPAVETPLTRVGTANVGSDVNGGGYAKLSPTSHKDYTFTWGASPAQDIYDIVDYRSGAYGDGLLYYIDPFAMRTNILPQSFSVPSLLCDIGKMSGTVTAPSGTRTVLTNLFTNPSFEGSGVTVEVWRNYFLGSNASSTGAGWGGWSGTTGNTAVNTAVDAPWSLSGTAIRRTWSAVADPNSGDCSINVQASLTGLEGQTITVVRRIVASRSGLVLSPPTLAVVTGQSAPAAIARSRSTNLTATAGEVITDWVTFTVPATIQQDTRFYTSVSSKVEGDYVEQSMGDIYLGSYQPNRKWFSGSFSPDSDLTPAWTGTVNNSASILHGVKTPNVSQSSINPIRSSQWASKGGYSVRLIPYGTTSDTSMYIAGSTSGLTGQGVTLIGGKTYTVVGTSRTDMPLTGTLNGRAGGFRVVYNTVAGWTGSVNVGTHIPTPTIAGEYRHRLTFTLPSDVVWCLVQLYCGASVGNGDVWWDDVALVEGEHPDLMPFDGSNPWHGYKSRWTGAVNASTSELQLDITSPLYTKRPLPLPRTITDFTSDPVFGTPIPPNYNLWVNYTATMPCLQINDSLVTETQPDASVVWHKVMGSWATLRWSRSGTSTIWGAQAIMLPEGETPPPVPKWYLGHGNWGLRFSTEPQVVGITARLGGEGGLLNGVATFKETGLWE